MEPVEATESNQTHEKKDLAVSIDRLISAIETLVVIQKKVEKQNRLGPTIIRAIFYALGSTLGLAIVSAVIFYLLNAFGIFGSLTNLLNSAKDLKNMYQ